MAAEQSEKPIGLALLREPFPDHQIGKLPKPTKQQTDEVKADFKKGSRCAICGQWHHPAVVHLDYVGHAALTDRLLDADIKWGWEPLSYGPDGLPAFDKNGGLWIRLTVLGVTRIGYGSADGKTGGDAVKEAIGDALRNSGMRFGAALSLWHKGDLHVADDTVSDEPKIPLWVTAAKAAIECLNTQDDCGEWYKMNKTMLANAPQEERDDVLAKLKHRKGALAPAKPPPREVKKPAQTYAEVSRGGTLAADPFADDPDTGNTILDDEIPF